ncbi:hypothetical protein D3C85_1894730 [compost metagenome]
MTSFCTFLFAKTNRDHLHDAALDASAESRMRFDAVDDNNGIRFGGDAIYINGQPIRQFIDFHHIHG